METAVTYISLLRARLLEALKSLDNVEASIGSVRQIEKTLTKPNLELTPTEMQVIELVKKGKSTAREIAIELSSTPKNIHSHFRNVRKKLGVQKTKHLISYFRNNPAK